MTPDDIVLESLSQTGQCAPTLAAYRQYAAPIVDSMWHVAMYEHYADNLAHWQQCCPGGKAQVKQLIPPAGKAAPRDLYAVRRSDLPASPAFASGAPCIDVVGRAMDDWLAGYDQKAKQAWNNAYAALGNSLHTCCIERYNVCLQENASDPSGAALTVCDEILTPPDTAFWVVVTLGMLLLLMGFGLGIPGRTRREARLTCGALNALLAAGIYSLAIMYFLPDRRILYLLFGAALALLVAAGRLFLRLHLLYGNSGQQKTP